jgi:hypothetical protein
MDNDDNLKNLNWNVVTSANGGNENVLEEQSEQQVFCYDNSESREK